MQPSSQINPPSLRSSSTKGIIVLQRPNSNPHAQEDSQTNQTSTFSPSNIQNQEQNQQNPSESIDETIIAAINNQRDRTWVLNLEREIEKFLQDPKVSRLDLPAITPYQRLVVHRVAQYFQLDHAVVGPQGAKRAISLFKNHSSQLPKIRLASLVPSSQQPQSNTTRSVTILPREKRTNKDTRQKQKNSNSSLSGSSTTGMSKKTIKTLEQREEDYAKARARIFSDFSPEDSGQSELPVKSNEAQPAIEVSKNKAELKPSLSEPNLRQMSSPTVPVLPEADKYKDATKKRREGKSKSHRSNIDYRSSRGKPTNPQTHRKQSPTNTDGCHSYSDPNLNRVYQNHWVGHDPNSINSTQIPWAAPRDPNEPKFFPPGGNPYYVPYQSHAPPFMPVDLPHVYSGNFSYMMNNFPPYHPHYPVDNQYQPSEQHKETSGSLERSSENFNDQVYLEIRLLSDAHQEPNENYLEILRRYGATVVYLESGQLLAKFSSIEQANFALQSINSDQFILHKPNT